MRGDGCHIAFGIRGVWNMEYGIRYGAAESRNYTRITMYRITQLHNDYNLEDYRTTGLSQHDIYSRIRMHSDRRLLKLQESRFQYFYFTPRMHFRASNLAAIKSRIEHTRLTLALVGPVQAVASASPDQSNSDVGCRTDARNTHGIHTEHNGMCVQDSDTDVDG